MLSCDLCKKPLEGLEKVKHVADSKTGRHICVDCIGWCVKISKDDSTEKLVYLNQYKEEYERKRRPDR